MYDVYSLHDNKLVDHGLLAGLAYPPKIYIRERIQIPLEEFSKKADT